MAEKKVIKALKTRYNVLDWDNNRYFLYDKNRPAKLMNGADFVAEISLTDNNNKQYSYNGKVYDDVDSLSTAIDTYIESLPFYHGYYDPSYRKNVFIEMCCRDYIKSLGFSTEGTNFATTHFKITSPDGNILFTISLDVEFNESKGKVYKQIGVNQMVSMNFDGLDEAISAINTMLAYDTLISASAAMKILNNMSKGRYSGKIKDIKLNTSTYDVYVTDKREELIKALEYELEELKKLR